MDLPSTSSFELRDLGRLGYAEALEIQQQLVEQRKQGLIPDQLLFVEHPHVYTIGRGGNQANVVAPGEVPVYRTGRGGDVTYHGPGQLVAYPIIDLRSKLRKDVHRYVRNLELSAIRTLKDFGLTAIRRPPYTGIWIGDRKIAAIGVRVMEGLLFGVSQHDPGTFALVPLIVVGVGLVATWIPAWRATRVEPIETLRAE